MTSKTIYRLILATLLLPNFTAYWWMLPRRFKRCRTWQQALMQIECRAMARKVFENWQHYNGIMAVFNSAEIAPISEREFRIPFQVNR